MTDPGPSGRPSGRPAGRIAWRSPQVLIPALAVLAAAVWALQASPPALPDPPELHLGGAEAEAPAEREAVLYLVDGDLARPQVRTVPDAPDPSARAQAVVDALAASLREVGDWPDSLPAPRVFAFEHERASVVALDLPAHEVRLDVAAERRIVASFERTLLEDGHDRLVFLRDGAAEGPWLGRLAVPSDLE